MTAPFVHDDRVQGIEPWPAGTLRPFWSVMIPTYNSGRLLETTLASVLAQDPGPEQMQIEVVDDCSPRDDPHATVRAIAGDRVTVYRQPRNVGATRNFNTCIERARGRWVHILHSDDAARPGLYDTLRRFISGYPDVGMVFCRAIIVDDSDRWVAISSPLGRARTTGVLESPFFDLAVANVLVAPAVAVERATYERLGGFNPALKHTADWEMWLRVAAAGPIGYVDEPLILRREHELADTARLAATGANLAEIAATLRWARSQVADRAERRALRLLAHEHHAAYALSWRYRFARQRRYRAAWHQARWAFALRPGLANAVRLAASTFSLLLPSREPAHWDLPR